MLQAQPLTEIDAYAAKNLPRPMRSHVDLDRAYEFFNRELFGGILPPCLVTLERHGRAFGYFCAERFANIDDGTEIVDEIALNPIHFARRMTSNVLSTLAHEMVHLWQFHFDKPSRGGYHNRRWAAKMIEIGLVPTSTGEPGGKPTGECVSHFIREDGPFDRACAALLEQDATVLFQDRAYCVVQLGERADGEGPDGDDHNREGHNGHASDIEAAVRERERKAASKTRYQCPTPGCTIAWAKRGSKFICAKCDEEMLP